MFEKEAEEYQTEKRKRFNEHEQLCWGDVYKDFQKGAEFGYNKGKEDMKTTILKLRNCMNCKYRDTRGYSSCKDKGIVLCSHWEMKE